MPTGKSREKMREEVANLCNLSNTAGRGDCEKLGLEKCDSNPGPMVQKRHRRALKRRPEESCHTVKQQSKVMPYPSNGCFSKMTKSPHVANFSSSFFRISLRKILLETSTMDFTLLCASTWQSYPSWYNSDIAILTSGTDHLRMKPLEHREGTQGPCVTESVYQLRKSVLETTLSILEINCLSHLQDQRSANISTCLHDESAVVGSVNI